MHSIFFLYSFICLLLDYHWRDYFGKTPKDALIAGKDLQNNNLYIGQVLYQDKLIVGKISKGDRKIYFEFLDVEYSTDKHVKVLGNQLF